MAGSRRLSIEIVGDARGLSGMFREADSAFKKFGRAAAVGLGAAGALGAAALTKGFVDALGAEDMEARIGGQLGVSPERAAELGGIASGLYRDAWGDSLGQVGDAVVAAEQSLGNLSPEGLESATSKALAFADVFDTDVNAAINAAGELMTSGLATDADHAFDLLTAGFQEMPIAIRDELMEASNEYGTFFGQLGLSGEEAFGLLAAAGENGIYGIDKTGDALKELTIRATDMSTASVDAFTAAGLSAEDMAAGFLAGGEDARAALGDTVEGLLGIEDPVEQANAAIALFGTPLEDLGTAEIDDFLQSLQNMDGGLGDVTGSAQEMADTLGGTNSAKIEAFKRKALGGLADFAGAHLIPAFEEFAEWMGEELPGAIATAQQWIDTKLMPVLRQVAPIMQDLWAKYTAYLAVVWPAIIDGVAAVIGVVRENWPEIQAIITRAVEAIESIVTSVVSILTTMWEQFGDDILGFVQAVWPEVQQVIQGAIDVIEGIFLAFDALLRGDWSALWSALGQIVSGAWGIITGIISGAVDLVQGIVGAAWGVLKDITTTLAGDIVAAIAGIPGQLLGLILTFAGAGFSLARALLDGLGSALSSVAGWAGDVGAAVVGAVKSLINSQVIGRINSALEFTIPLPFGLGSFTVNPPDIPYLAKGGIITGPTLAVVGEAGPEAVVPLSRASEFGLGGGGPIIIELHVDGRRMAKAVADASQRVGGLPFKVRGA